MEYYEDKLLSNNWAYTYTRHLLPDVEKIVFCKRSYAFKISHHSNDTTKPLFWIDVDSGLNDCPTE